MQSRVVFGAVLLGLFALSLAQGTVNDIDASKFSSKLRPQTEEARDPTAYPNLYEGGATKQEKGMMDWLYGLSFVDGGVTFQKSFGTSGRNFVYTRNVKQGEEIFALPVPSMVYTSNPHMSTTSKHVVNLFRENFRSPGSVAEDFELTEMGLIIMFERRDPNSFWKHYLGLIQDPLCPAFYTDAELAKFEYPWIKTWRLYFLSDSIKNFRKLFQLPEMKEYNTPDSEFEFLWAVSTVLQRSFDWGPDTRREYVMVPYLDMVNHKAQIQNNYYYSHGPFTQTKADGTVERLPMPRGMVLGSDSDHKAGDEVFISYSTSSNNVQLLLQYGFLVPDNEHDYIILTMQEPKDDTIANQVEALGPVISVGLNGVISTDFVRAINVVLNRKPEVTVAAYELILKFVQEDFGKFTTTLGEDVQAIKASGLSRAEWSALAYRIEAKKHLKSIIEHVNKQISNLKDGLTLKEVKSSGEKIDWPSRFIKVMFDGTPSDTQPSAIAQQ